MGYIFIGQWDSLPLLATRAWHERADSLFGWCQLYVVASALLAVFFHSREQFLPLKGWGLGVIWTTRVFFTLSPIVAAQFFLFVVAPAGILHPIIANVVAGTAGILLGNLVLIGVSWVTVSAAVSWESNKNPFFVEVRMLHVWQILLNGIPPTTRSIVWPAKAVISLMVGYETIRDWGWV